MYTIENGGMEKSKSIDVKKVIEKAEPHLSPVDCRSLFLSEQRKIAGVNVYNKTTGKEEEVVYLDIETEEIYQDRPKMDNNYTGKQALVTATNFSQLTSTYGVDFINSSNASGINILDYFLDNKNETVNRAADWETLPVLKVYPELKGYFEVEKDKTRAQLYLDEQLTGEEIIAWIYPENKNVFDELILENYESIDNEKHRISSLEMFNQYYVNAPLMLNNGC